MKFAAFAVVLLATPALAQTPAVPATAPAARLNLDTPVATIAADPAGKAVLNADIPGLLTHPMYDSFKGMDLHTLQGLAGGKLTAAMLAKTAADLSKIR